MQAIGTPTLLEARCENSETNVIAGRRPQNDPRFIEPTGAPDMKLRSSSGSGVVIGTVQVEPKHPTSA